MSFLELYMNGPNNIGLPNLGEHNKIFFSISNEKMVKHIVTKLLGKKTIIGIMFFGTIFLEQYHSMLDQLNTKTDSDIVWYKDLDAINSAKPDKIIVFAMAYTVDRTNVSDLQSLESVINGLNNIYYKNKISMVIIFDNFTEYVNNYKKYLNKSIREKVNNKILKVFGFKGIDQDIESLESQIEYEKSFNNILKFIIYET